MEFERGRLPRRQVSLIPLIDVGFFLLVFFLIGGSIAPFEIVPVNLPIANTASVQAETDVTVLLGRHDELVVNDAIVTMEGLADAVRTALKANPQAPVTLKADGNLPAGRLMETIRRLRAAGARDVLLMTQSPN